MKRRVFLMSTSLVGLPTFAQSKSLLFAVNESLTYSARASEASDRYAALLTDLNRKQNAAFKMERVAAYADVEAGLKAGRYDLALVHPAQLSLAALQSGQYRLVAVSKAHINYKAYFLTRNDSPIKTMAQLSGHTLLTPDATSVTAWLTRATLAEAFPAGQPGPMLRSVRFQDAVRLAVENKMADAGVTASAAEVKEWQAAGHTVLASSRAAPVKMLLAHKRLDQPLDGLRSFFEAQTDLAKIGVPEGFVGFDEAVALKIWEWLKHGVPAAA